MSFLGGQPAENLGKVSPYFSTTSNLGVASMHYTPFHLSYTPFQSIGNPGEWLLQ